MMNYIYSVSQATQNYFLFDIQHTMVVTITIDTYCFALGADI